MTEPFFTTKDAGKGTGLGLSMVAGFVQQSGGMFAVDSEPGVGTSIDILLPTTGDAPVQLQETTRAAAGIDEIRILLVDDDEAVRTVIGEQLLDLGADVESAESGEKALALAQSSGAFDVILSDYAMPGMNGVETIRAVREVQPQIRAVLLTGYAEDDALDADDSSTVLLRKPIGLNDLVHVLVGREAQADGESEPPKRRLSGSR